MNSSLLRATTCAAVLLLGRGAAAQIELVEDLVPGSLSGNPVALAELEAFDSVLLYLAKPAGRLKLYEYDGTSSRLIQDLPVGQPSQFVRGVSREGRERLFFTIQVGGTSELWSTSGSQTTFLWDRRGAHEQVTPVRDEVVFTDNPTAGQELWHSEKGRTFRVNAIEGDYDFFRVPTLSELTQVRPSLVLFVANVEITAGIDKGKTRRDLLVHRGGSQVRLVDGVLKDSWPTNLTYFNDRVFYSALDGNRKRELWVTDGKTCKLFMDLTPNSPPDSPGSSPRGFTVVEDRMFFWANTGMGTELWVTDGTELGTTRVGAVIPAGGVPAQTGSRVGDMFLFAMRTPTEGIEYWVSYGSKSSTELLRDINPTGSSRPHFPLPLGSRYTWFVADDGVHGNELWQTDGETTAMVKDLYPGIAPSSPQSLTHYKGRIYFSAKTQKTGRELFSVKVPAVSETVGRGHSAEGTTPTLRSDDPVIGSTMQVTGAGLPIGSNVGLLLGFPGAPWALAPDVVIHFDPNSPIALVGAEILDRSSLELSIRIPSIASLQGKIFTAQMGGLDKDRRLLVTNAVRLIVDY